MTGKIVDTCELSLDYAGFTNIYAGVFEVTDGSLELSEGDSDSPVLVEDIGDDVN